MARTFEPPIAENQECWVLKQHIFFVATAALAKSNHVNVSPKSATGLRIVDGHTIGYLDLAGSGAETAAHIMENERLTFMFVALRGAPRIMRFYGRGEVIPPHALFGELRYEKFRQAWGLDCPEAWENVTGARSIILLHIEKFSDSCGYSIPIYEYVKERSTYNQVTQRMDVQGFTNQINAFSIDGLKSISQLVHQQTPPSRNLSEGYYLGPRNWQENSSKIARLKVRILMLWSSGLNGRVRDFVHLLLGALGLCILQRLLKLSSLTPPCPEALRRKNAL